jgi:type I restriction enzyme S subunit
MTIADWRTMPLGEALTFQRGFDITKDDQREGPYPVISSSGPKSTHSEYKSRGPGVVIGRKGSLGTVFYSEGEYWPHDTTLWVKDFHGNHPRFAYYLLQTMGLERLDAGASNPSLNRNHIHTIPVRWPSLPVQRRIAGILLAYDELIENSQRRVRILEAMARAVYREWFVHFRFPGQENRPRIASPLGEIPQGWGVRRLKDVAAVIYGFPFASKRFNTDGNGTPVIRIRDIPTGFSSTFTDEAAEPKYFVENGDILVGMDGDFHMCIWSSGHALQNQRVARFNSKGQIGNLHLFLALEKPIQEFNKAIVGTTVAHLGDMHIKTIELVWPPAKLREQALEILEPMSEEGIVLKRQIQNLRRTRDSLLPRLVLGQVEVGAL